jgi:hypothetical protein
LNESLYNVDDQLKSKGDEDLDGECERAGRAAHQSSESTETTTTLSIHPSQFHGRAAVASPGVVESREESRGMSERRLRV